MAIGIFDSGLGGLTVVKEIKKRFPKVGIKYLGDTARVPYGTRSREVVQQFAVEDAKFLESLGVSEIIIACNTASALAFEQVKNAVSVPVYEVISAAKKQAETIGTRIGVIGTRGTIGSGAYGHVGIACPLLVPFIEEGELDSPALKVILQDYLK
ncbi:MAG: Glutamate racemase [Candidatus Amesbacteria bacterium GW2011_GWA2_42_12]|uniref:Glutamate racemase n=1 Tax=Candidatus Amesbacteria bacterium GW2011_GWA2_42_12 TaxID=1618356 RepID=A0A0G1AE80_9BACT|nr:MAG: Glutamate racemase [Candidatus Amesbacteria bacterium GW2011_GWA2_42_12]